MPVIKNIDKKSLLDAIRDNDEFGEYAARAWHERVKPYIPYNTGRLCNDVTYQPMKIIYNAPYAKDVYNNLKMNFRKDKHPLATARWDEVAMPAVKDYFIQDLQDYLKRINFNG